MYSQKIKYSNTPEDLYDVENNVYCYCMKW